MKDAKMHLKSAAELPHITHQRLILRNDMLWPRTCYKLQRLERFRKGLIATSEDDDCITEIAISKQFNTSTRKCCAMLKEINYVTKRLLHLEYTLPKCRLDLDTLREAISESKKNKWVAIV